MKDQSADYLISEQKPIKSGSSTPSSIKIRQTFSQYEVQLLGINCTTCANKIKQNLGQMEKVKNVKVNVIAQKVQFQIPVHQSPDEVLQKLTDLNFKIVSEVINLTDGGNANNEFRSAVFRLMIPPKLMSKMTALQSEIQCEIGVIEVQLKQEYFQLSKDQSSSSLPNDIISNQIIQQKPQQGLYEQEDAESIAYRMSIVYDPALMNAKDLLEKHLEPSELQFTALNTKLDVFKSIIELTDKVTKRDLIIALSSIVILISGVMILPQMHFMTEPILFPTRFGILSLYLQILFLFTLATLYKFGLPCYKRSLHNLFNGGNVNMETLITMGSLSAFIMGLYMAISHFIFDSSTLGIMQRKMDILMVSDLLMTGALITTIIYLGKYLEHKAKLQILKMSADIFPHGKLFQNTKVLCVEPKNRKFLVEKERVMEVSLVEKDTYLKVQQGDTLLVDSLVVNGNLTVQDSIVYGSDLPMQLKEGDRLRSGAQVLDGVGIVQVEHVLEKSMFYDIGKQLNIAQNNAQMEQSGLQSLFQTVSEHFIKFVIMASFLTSLVWMLLLYSGTTTLPESTCRWGFAIEKGISLLVVSCPCALGLAVPSVVALTLNMALKSGILIKKTALFENMPKIKSICFDKTGTLFNKVETIHQVYFIENQNQTPYQQAQLWNLVNLIEKDFVNHPLGMILYKQSLAEKQNDDSFALLNKPKQLRNGIESAVVQKKTNCISSVLMGNKTLHNEHKTVFPKHILDTQVIAPEKQGRTVLILAIDNVAQMVIQLDNHSNLRPEAKEVVTLLQIKYEKHIYILSGDANNTVESLGEHLGIPKERLLGEVDSQEKQKVLSKIARESNRGVMMIGDGLNDVLGLQEASVGVSINAKSELNLIASDVIILNANLYKIISLFDLMRLANIFIRINLVWAFSYNLVMMPMAAGLFGFSMSPLISSAVMSLSSVVVVCCANVMRFFYTDISHDKILEANEMKIQWDSAQNLQTNESMCMDKVGLLIQGNETPSSNTSSGFSSSLVNASSTNFETKAENFPVFQPNKNGYVDQL